MELNKAISYLETCVSVMGVNLYKEALQVVKNNLQTPTNKQSAPCLHVESLFVNKAGFDECRICGHIFRN